MLVDSDVLKDRALHLPTRLPSQTTYNIGICTLFLYSRVLRADYTLDVGYHGPMRGKTDHERRRTNGGKVKAEATVNVETRHEGDGTTSADEIIHLLRCRELGRGYSGSSGKRGPHGTKTVIVPTVPVAI